MFLLTVVPSISQPTFNMNQGLGTSPGLSYSPYLTPMTSMSHGMSLMPTEMLPSTPVMVPGSPGVTVQSSNSSSSSPSQKLLRTDKLEVSSHLHTDKNKDVLLSDICCTYTFVMECLLSVSNRVHCQGALPSSTSLPVWLSCCRCVASSSGGTVREARLTAASPTPATAP